jgi:hypothetical protein
MPTAMKVAVAVATKRAQFGQLIGFPRWRIASMVNLEPPPGVAEPAAEPVALQREAAQLAPFWRAKIRAVPGAGDRRREVHRRGTLG